MRPDILFETENELWIVEVKDRRYSRELPTANEQVQMYSRRITELGWWPNLDHHLCVVWAYPQSHVAMYRLKPWERIPSKNLDFINKTRRNIGT
jgi:hypothetical protein